jgi:hypothetical protein
MLRRLYAPRQTRSKGRLKVKVRIKVEEREKEGERRNLRLSGGKERTRASEICPVGELTF